jgi:hypothetical protein
MGAYEVLMADGGFEAGSLDGPWISPLGNFLSDCPDPAMATAGAIVGGRSLNITVGPCLEGLCNGCRSPFVYQTFTGLDTARTYQLSGKWHVLSGTAGPDSRIDFGFCATPPCAQSGCVNSVPCSATIGGAAVVDFSCPSFMVPTSSTMAVSVLPCLSPPSGGLTLAIDSLELR